MKIIQKCQVCGTSCESYHEWDSLEAFFEASLDAPEFAHDEGNRDCGGSAEYSAAEYPPAPVGIPAEGKGNMNAEQVRDTVRNLVKVGMEVKQNGKVVGHVTEVTSDGCVIYSLRRPKYTGSDERDDAGIPAGTKVTEGVLDLTEIAEGRVIVGNISRTVNDRWELI